MQHGRFFRSNVRTCLEWVRVEATQQEDKNMRFNCTRKARSNTSAQIREHDTNGRHGSKLKIWQSQQTNSSLAIVPYGVNCRAGRESVKLKHATVCSQSEETIGMCGGHPIGSSDLHADGFVDIIETCMDFVMTKSWRLRHGD